MMTMSRIYDDDDDDDDGNDGVDICVRSVCCVMRLAHSMCTTYTQQTIYIANYVHVCMCVAFVHDTSQLLVSVSSFQ